MIRLQNDCKSFMWTGALLTRFRNSVELTRNRGTFDHPGIPCAFRSRAWCSCHPLRWGCMIYPHLDPHREEQPDDNLRFDRIRRNNLRKIGFDSSQHYGDDSSNQFGWEEQEFTLISAIPADQNSNRTQCVNLKTMLWGDYQDDLK